MSQVEVLSVRDAGRRLRWSGTGKVRIVEESQAAPRWSRLRHDAMMSLVRVSQGGVARPGGGVPIGTADRAHVATVAAIPDVAAEPAAVDAPVRAGGMGHGRVEIVLPDGRRLVTAASTEATKVRAFDRRKPVRRAFSEHLPRERVVVEAPTTCAGCGSDRIRKRGEGITGTLEVVPRQRKAIRTAREGIPHPPAPFHPAPRG